MSFIYFLLLGLVSLPFTTYNQVIIGYFGDKIETRWGRRKPCIAVATVIYVICIFALAFPPGGFNLSNQKVLFGWGALFTTIVYIVADWLFLPLSSWFIESTADNADYIKIKTIPANIGGAVGGLMGFLASALLPHAVYCVIMVILIVPTTSALLYFVPNTQLNSVPKQPELIPSLRTCMRSKEFKTIFINKCLLFSAISISLGLLTFLYVTGFFPAIECYKEIIPLIVGVTVIIVIGSVAVLASLQCILAKYDKLVVYRTVCVLAAIIALAIFPVSLPKGFTGFYLVIATSVLLTYCLVVLGSIDGFFLRDLIVFDQFVTGLRRENMYQTSMALPASLCIQVVSNIPLAIINLSGFVSNTGVPTDDQIISRFKFNDATTWQLRVYASFLTAIIIFAANRMIKSYALNDKVATRLNDIVKKREEEAQARTISNDERNLKSNPLNNANTGSGSGSGSGGGVVSKDLEKTVSGSSVTTAPLVNETDEDLMYMNHFSQSEIAVIHGNFKSLSSLKTKVAVTIFFATFAMVTNIASMGLQINIGQGTFVVLTMTIVLFISLYLGYEILRFVIISKVGTMLEPQAKAIVAKALASNKSFFVNMNSRLKECGIVDSGSVEVENEEERESLAAPDKEEIEADKNNVAPEDREISGYKRIIFGLVILAIYGILGCTIFVYKQTNPDNHTPTMMPTLSSTLSTTGAPTLVALCHGK